MHGFTQHIIISLWCLKDPMSVSASSRDYASCSCWMTEQVANNGTHTNNNEHRSSAFYYCDCHVSHRRLHFRNTL